MPARAQLAARLLARMGRLRHLHLAISYVPSLPQLAHLLHLELRAIKFDDVQARAASPSFSCLHACQC